jgi:hypothetical protein
MLETNELTMTYNARPMPLAEYDNCGFMSKATFSKQVNNSEKMVGDICDRHI